MCGEDWVLCTIRAQKVETPTFTWHIPYFITDTSPINPSTVRDVVLLTWQTVKAHFAIRARKVPGYPYPPPLVHPAVTGSF
mmetsp:Transcript_70889/g.118549  ORF Transcript_70889/g.118549 Transcript_70889/m.118549 type:complete len:81 (+) Transcript_70889:668-910(+)